MKINPKIYRLFCIFCWIGTAIAAFLLAYLLHLTREYPEVEEFTRDVRIIGVLLLVWLAVSTWFTVRAVLEKKK